jgi:hypothetical protein
LKYSYAVLGCMRPECKKLRELGNGDKEK